MTAFSSCPLAQCANSCDPFTGKERDAETGLDFFLAKYYSGAQGRFASPDPLLASARLTDPQTWNRYAYVRNDPVNMIDPDGRFPTSVFQYYQSAGWTNTAYDDWWTVAMGNYTDWGSPEAALHVLSSLPGMNYNGVLISSEVGEYYANGSLSYAPATRSDNGVVDQPVQCFVELHYRPTMGGQTIRIGILRSALE